MRGKGCLSWCNGLPSRRAGCVCKRCIVSEQDAVPQSLLHLVGPCCCSREHLPTPAPSWSCLLLYPRTTPSFLESKPQRSLPRPSPHLFVDLSREAVDRFLGSFILQERRFGVARRPVVVRPGLPEPRPLARDPRKLLLERLSLTSSVSPPDFARRKQNSPTRSELSQCMESSALT